MSAKHWLAALGGIALMAGLVVIPAAPAGAVNTVPGAPTIVSIQPSGKQQLSIYFLPPANNGGCSITNYKYTTNGGAGSPSYKAMSPATTTSPLVITSRSDNPGNLNNRTPYTIKILAVNCVGDGTASSSVVATPGVPASPTITAISASSQQLSVAFTTPTSDGGSTITGYEYTTDGTNWKARTDSGTTGTPIVITQTSPSGTTLLTNGTSYPIQIRAINTNGSGVPSNTYYATPAGTPGAPTGLSATSDDRQIPLTWVAPTSNGGDAIIGYKVEYAAGPGYSSWNTFSSNTGDVTTTATVTGLTNGVSYKFRVSAINSLGTGTASTESSAVPVGVPSPPTITSASPGNQQMSLVFTAPDRDGGSTITSYQYSTDGGTNWKTRTDSGGTTSPMTITQTSAAGTTSVANSTSYTVLIRAVNSVGEGNSSNSVSVTPSASTTTPGAPTITTITPGDTTLSVAFTAGSDGGAAIDRYDYSTDNGSTWKTRTDSGGTTSPLVISQTSAVGTATLVNGTGYTVKIRAHNTNGNGTASGGTAGTPSTVPGAPTSVAATAGDTQATLTWVAPSSDGGSAVNGYKVEYSSDSGSNWSVYLSNTGTTAVNANVSGLTNGTSYIFRVSAFNSNGLGSASSSSSAVTPYGTASAPTITVVSPGDVQLSVGFTPPTSSGGTALSTYQYSTDDGVNWAPRDDGGTLSSPMLITATSDTTQSNRSLTNGTTYTVRVRAVSLGGSGAQSNSLTGVPASGNSVPGAPTLGTITPSTGTLSVAFTAGTTGGAAISGYEYSTDGGTSWLTRTDGGTTGSPIVITELSNGAGTPLVNGNSYSIKVRAINGAGTGTASSSTTSTPGDVPNEPTGVTAVPGDGSASIGFTAPSNDGGLAITNYAYSLNNGNTWTVMSPSTTSSPLLITGISNGQSKQIKIRAINAAGDGAASSGVSVTPSQYTPRPSSVTITPASGPTPTQLSWASISGQWATSVSSYNVVYRKTGQTRWYYFARGSTSTTVDLNNPGTLTTCSSSNTAGGWTRCAMRQGWITGQEYQFSVFATGTNGVNPLANGVPLSVLGTYTP